MLWDTPARRRIWFGGPAPQSVWKPIAEANPDRVMVKRQQMNQAPYWLDSDRRATVLGFGSRRNHGGLPGRLAVDIARSSRGSGSRRFYLARPLSLSSLTAATHLVHTRSRESER